MASGPGGGNQPTFIPGVGGIPNVAPGDQLQTAHLNKISEAISKINPAGGDFTQSPTGITLRKGINFGRQLHPWMAKRANDLLFIEPGQFFINTANAGGFNLVTNGEKLNGGRNAWLFNSAIGSSPAYTGQAPLGFHMGGAEIWFEDEFMNVLSNKQMFIGMDTLFTKALTSSGAIRAGLYYIEVAPWGGRQMTTPYPNTNGNPILNTFNQSITQWNAHSLTMKGKYVPQFRFAPEGPTDPKSMFNVKSLVYPICTMDQYGSVYQGIRGDIYHVATPPRPFDVSLFKDGTTTKASVYPGLVNRQIPTISGAYLDQLPTPTLTITGAGRIFLKASHESNKFFPRSIEVIFQSGTTTPEDTEQYGYYPIASIASQSGQQYVTQLSWGNKLVNRFKMGASGAYWSWSA